VKKNIAALDGLRAFACLLVVFGHFAKEEIIFDIKGSGQLGVMLFFVLSGFLMAYLYGDERLTIPRLVEYSFRRFFRVFPAYLAILALSFLLTPYWAAFPYAMDLSGFLKHVKLQGDTSVFWTIPVEIKFYLLFPLLWLVLGLIPSSRVRAVLMLGVFIEAVNTYPCGECDRLDLARYVEFFIGGVCAGYIQTCLHIDSAWKKHAINVLFGVSLVLVVVFIPQVFLHLTGIIHPMWQMPQVLATLFALCVLCCANASGWLQQVFASRAMTFLGKISFSLYLLHFPVIVFLGRWTSILPAVLQVLVALGAAVVLSYLSYLSIEKTFRRLGFLLNQRLQTMMAHA
jgi:peptidoglycan/LPS O-acetylase OafA/YrhL